VIEMNSKGCRAYPAVSILRRTLSQRYAEHAGWMSGSLTGSPLPKPLFSELPMSQSGESNKLLWKIRDSLRAIYDHMDKEWAAGRSVWQADRAVPAFSPITLYSNHPKHSKLVTSWDAVDRFASQSRAKKKPY